MRFLITFILIFTNSLATLGFTFSPYTPDSSKNYNSYPKITKLETIILNKTYENDDIEKRLSRLEKKVCSKCFKEADFAWRVDNITSNIDQSTLYNIPSKDLANIEKKILGKSYKKDNLENRLTRLEVKMLGATQSGSIDDRYQTILTASNHYIDFGNNYNSFEFNNIEAQNNNGFKNTLKSTISSLFGMGGHITGYTPPINNYNFSPYGFNNSFNNHFNNSYRNKFWNNRMNKHNCHRCHHMPFNRHIPRYTQPNNHIPGWYSYNNSINTGCGVHILD